MIYLGHNTMNSKYQQDGPSLESSLYLNVSLRYLGPWDHWTLGLLDLKQLWKSFENPPSKYSISERNNTNESSLENHY